jgi:hypothetical protein
MILQRSMMLDRIRFPCEPHRDCWRYTGYSVTESDVREYGTNPYMIIKNALQEGRELYHATG